MVAGAAVAAAFGVLDRPAVFSVARALFCYCDACCCRNHVPALRGLEHRGRRLGLSIPVAEAGLASFQFHRDRTPYYYIALAMLAGVTALVWWLSRSRLGYILQAIRDDEEALRSLGFSPSRYKLDRHGDECRDRRSRRGCSTPSMFSLSIPQRAHPCALGPYSAVPDLRRRRARWPGRSSAQPCWCRSRSIRASGFSGSGRNVDLLIYGFLIMVIAVYRPNGVMSLFELRGVQAARGAARHRQRACWIVAGPRARGGCGMKLRLEFERGGVLNVRMLQDKAPETARAVAAASPISAKVYQARWSGKEIFVPIDIETKPPRENQTHPRQHRRCHLFPRMGGQLPAHRLRGDRPFLRQRDRARVAWRRARQRHRPHRSVGVRAARDHRRPRLAQRRRGDRDPGRDVTTVRERVPARRASRPPLRRALRRP